MFEELDELFDQIFSRIDQEFMTGFPQVSRYPIMVPDDEEPQEISDDAASRFRVTGEPVAEVHHIGNEVKVITGLPGITDGALRLDVQGDQLIIDAGDANHHYHTSAALPPVDTGSMKKSLRNGVLEVTFSVIQDRSEKE